MKYLIYFFTFFASVKLVSAQSRDKLTVGGYITPLFTLSFNTSSSNELMPNGRGQTYSGFNDSVSSTETYRFSYGAGLLANYLLNNKWSLQFGIGYMDVGFQRQQKDIQFGDYTHPGIGTGRIIDLSGANRSIDYNYRYQYLQVPVLANYTFKQSSDYRWLFQASGGLAVNVLLKHQLSAVLNQFVEDGESEFDIDSTGYEGNRFALSVFLGAKAEYRYEKKITLFAQPLIGFYPLSVSSTPINVFPLVIGLNMGVVYTIDDL